MSITLTLIVSGRAYEQLSFEQFTRLRIGRSPDCDIHVDNLAVSRHHAEIVNAGGVHVLRVVGKNPTFVNGARIESHGLNDGDLISIGKFTIAYANDDPWSAVGPSPEGRALGGASVTIVGSAQGAQAREDSFQHLPAYVVAPKAAPQPLEQPFYLFGKWARAEFRLRGLTAPRCGAILLREDNGYRLVDLSPKRNLVKVNGAPVRDHRLSEDDELEVGGHRLTFHLGRPGPDAARA